MSIYVSRASKRGGPSSPVTPNSSNVSTSSSIEEVKAKLNFSLANRSPLLKTSRVTPYNVPLHNNKYHLREYHMSRQDPAVLDHMYFSNSHLDSTLHKSSPDTFNRPPQRLPMGLPSAPLARAGQRQSVVMAALRKHVLTNNRSPPGVSSLVRLASQGPATSSRNLTISPVVVHHSPVNNKPLLDISKLSTISPPSNLPPQPDPCDKDVVVSALKQKSRKRWFNRADSHSPADDQSILSQPMAKRSKPIYYSSSNRDHLTNKLSTTTSHEVVGSKRSSKASSFSAETLPKRPALLTKRNRISLHVPDPDMVAAEDNSQLPSSPVTVTLVATEESEAHSDESDLAKEEEEALLKLKQKLTQVFPSPSSGHSSCKRKKRPVYCATGSVMPLPPPSAYPVTAEDLRKDREDGLARIRRYLLSDNDSNQVSADEKQHISSLALSTSSSALLSVGPLPTITTTTATIGSNFTLGGGLNIGVTASASAPSILGKPVCTTTASVGGSLGELGKLSNGDIAKQPTLPSISSNGPSFFANSAATLLPTASNCNLVSSSDSVAMFSSVSSSSISASASPMLCSRATSTTTVSSKASITTLVSSDASASSVTDGSCSVVSNTGSVTDNSSISSITNNALSSTTSVTNTSQLLTSSVSSAASNILSSASGLSVLLNPNGGLPLASGPQVDAASNSSVLAPQAASSFQLPGTALPQQQLHLLPQGAQTSNSQTGLKLSQQASTVSSASQSLSFSHPMSFTNQPNVLSSFAGSTQQSIASSAPSIVFGQQLNSNKQTTSQQTEGIIFGTLQTSTSQTLPSSLLGIQQPSAAGLPQPSNFGLQQQPSATRLQQLSGTGLQQLSGFGLQQQSATGLQQRSGTGLQQLSGFGLQQQSATGLQQRSGTGLQQLSGFGLQQQSATGLQQQSATALQQLSGFGLQQQSATGLQQPSGTGLQQLSGFGLQQQSATGLQQPSGTGLQQLSGFGLQQQSATGLQQPSSTGLPGFSLQPSATGLKQPSATGLSGFSLQPSTTALQQPSTTGLLGFGLQQQPSATGLPGFGLQPSASGLQQPSASGLQQPSGFGSQLSGGANKLKFGATKQPSIDQATSSAIQQTSAGGLNAGNSMFGAKNSTVGGFGSGQFQQGSIFGGNNLLQSSAQQQPSSVNLFGGTSTTTAQFQFGGIGSNSIQSTNLFGGNAASINNATTASSMPSTFNFGLSSQPQQTSTTTTSTFQFTMPANQAAAPSNTGLFGAQNQQKAMTGFSFSLGSQQQQQQPFQFSGATGQLSGGMSNKPSVMGQPGGFNFSANESATSLFGSQSSTQQLMASSTSGFNFSAAAQTPSFKFAAGGNSKPGTPISKSSSKTGLRKKTRK